MARKKTSESGGADGGSESSSRRTAGATGKVREDTLAKIGSLGKAVAKTALA